MIGLSGAAQRCLSSFKLTHTHLLKLLRRCAHKDLIILLLSFNFMLSQSITGASTEHTSFFFTSIKYLSAKVEEPDA